MKMEKKKKKAFWLWTACAVSFLGLLLMGFGFVMLKGDFKSLSTEVYETREYEIAAPYERIALSVDTADVLFLPSEAGQTRVVCHERAERPHTVEVREGALVIEGGRAKSWRGVFGIGFDTEQVRVYLPAAMYSALSIESSTGDVTVPADFSFERVEISLSTGDVSMAASVTGTLRIKTSTGDIRATGLSVGALEASASTGRIELTRVSCAGTVSVRVSTGDVKLEDLTCTHLVSVGGTGDLHMKNVLAAADISVERSTGDVKLEACDASSLVIVCDTGSVSGTLRSDKTFIAHSDSGRVAVPKGTTGGRCEITTDTGDIRITVVAG